MAKLTEEEKEKALRLIASDQPLPDKFRFLLFGEHPGLELVWSGKSGRPSPAPARLCRVEHAPLKSAQSGGWTNLLIKADNRLALAALLKGPFREEIERQGGLKLIYIDPPFDAGQNFSMNLKLGASCASNIKAHAYSDNWGSGSKSFINMISERLYLMHELLADNGSIYVHCDWRTNACMRFLLDEIFKYRINEIIWHYTGGGRSESYFSSKHDTIFLYAKSPDFIFNGEAIRIPYNTGSAYAKSGIVARSGKRYLPKAAGKLPDDVWDIPIINPMSSERLGYPTQKPETLLERIIKASSNPGDLVADFFCGSGTLPFVAQKLGRKWLAVDSGKMAIHCCRKRLLQSPVAASFEILETAGAPEQQPECPDFAERVLQAYKAKPVEGFNFIKGEKEGRMIALANRPTASFLQGLLAECMACGILRLDILAREFPAGLPEEFMAQAAATGLDLVLRHIPQDIDNPATCHELNFRPGASIRTRLYHRAGKLAVALTGFCPWHGLRTQKFARGSGAEVFVITAKGQLATIKKGKAATSLKIISRNWTDWLDYWAVDFAYHPAPGQLSAKDDHAASGSEEEAHKRFFSTDWWTFREKNGRLRLISQWHSIGVATGHIAVKLVDIFGNEYLRVLQTDETA